MGNQFIIADGDWNVLLNMNTDSHSYRGCVNHPWARRKLMEMMEKFELIDVWCEVYPEKWGYTRRKFNASEQGHLNYFLISDQILPEIQGIKINPSYCSHRAFVSLELKTENRKSGKEFWKFNNSLLKDKNYIVVIKRLIFDLKKQYVVPVYKYNLDNIEILLKKLLSFKQMTSWFLKCFSWKFVARLSLMQCTWREKKPHLKNNSLKK